MSRSRKGSKAPGYEYWSKRPCSGLGYGPGVKHETHRVERRINKDIVREEKKMINRDD